MRRITLSPEFFLVRITDDAAAPAYQAEEVWLNSSAAVVEKVGGRRLTAKNPGRAVNGATFAEGDLAICRAGLGAAGMLWELVPIGSGGGLTVQEVDGVPSYPGIGIVQFDQADGFIVSQPAAGVARVGFDPSKITDCTGCGWFAGMGVNKCLKVSVNGTDTEMYLFTEDGNSWTAGDLLTICGTDYIVQVKRNPGGVPQLTLTVPGSGGAVKTGQWNCCGCAYAKWAFNLQDLCPDEPDTGDPCTNVVEVRVDLVDCPFSCAAGIPAALDTWYTGTIPHQTNGFATQYFYCIPVTPGRYRIRSFATIGPSGDYAQIFLSYWGANGCTVGPISNGASDGENTVGDPSGYLGGTPGYAPLYTQDNPLCQEFVVPEGAVSLCVRVSNTNAIYDYDYGFIVEEAECVGSEVGCADGAGLEAVDTWVQTSVRKGETKYLHFPVTAGNTYYLDFVIYNGFHLNWAETTFAAGDCSGSGTAGPSGEIAFDWTVGEITIPGGDACLCVTFTSPASNSTFKVALRPGSAP